MSLEKPDQIFEEALHRIPSSVQRYLQDLRDKGLLTKTINFYPENGTQTPIDELQNEFAINIRRLIKDDRSQQAFGTFRLVWLLNIFHQTSDEEMHSNLYKIHTNWPDQKSSLDKNEVSIINQYTDLYNRVSKMVSSS